MSASMLRHVLRRTPTLPKTCATTLVGLEEQKKDVLKLLKLEDMEEIRVVVLHGMGGVGKSTLAETVYNKAASAMSGRMRCCRIEVGQKPSKLHITSLQREMVEVLTGDSLQYMERDEVAIQDKWRQVLLSEGDEPLFIYIDNVLQREDLEDVFNLDCRLIQIPKGSRLLVTTRDISVCNKVLQRNQHFIVKEYSVKVLNDKDAKRLFCWHAFGEEEPSAESVKRYQGLIENMVSCICGNLPLALQVLGRSLFNEDVSFWRKKYSELKSKLSRDSGFEVKVTNVLKASYDTLDSETQVAFLVACVCFYDCRIKHFTDCVASVFSNATSRRLFEVGLLEREVKSSDGEGFFNVKIHDLIRNLGYDLATKEKNAYCTLLTSKEDFSNMKEESWSALKWLRVPPLEDGIDAEVLEKCKKLEILVLHTRVNGHIRNPPQHLKAVCSTSSVSIEIDKLEELVFWNVFNDLQEKFPVTPSTSALQVFHGFRGPHISQDAIDCHKNTLCKLSCEGLVELSSNFCEKMTELQSLQLEQYEGESFPKEMGSLVGLEELYVTSTTMQEVPRSLAHLQRLQMLDLDLQNLKEMPSGALGAAMTELVRLDLTLGRVKSIPMQDIGQLAWLEVLYLHLPSVERLSMEEDGVSLDLKLEKLRWFNLRSKSMSSLEGVRLSCPSLECLILELGKLEVLPSTFITGATQLRSVRLDDCDCLQELPAGVEMLGAVESLLLWDCPALKALPEGLMQKKKGLESLGVVGCGGMGRLPGDVVERAGGMRLLLCDAHLLPDHLLPLPGVVSYSPGDWRAQQRLDSFLSAAPPPIVNFL